MTVSGLSIQSQFCIQMKIKVQGVLGIEEQEKEFPIVIRSPPCGKYLVDTEAIGNNERLGLCSREELPEFFQPLSLAGCNINAL